MTDDLNIDVRIVSAHAKCRECEWEAWGRDVKDQPVRHVREVGHAVTVNSNTMTMIAPSKGET